ncbi:hypothetical protein FA15DRAFT_673270 [Coprinopsis marcescibilis]|uniref:Uncharacterized protein n=1 Tax=Coprinopsis marcescibilis TaxID=230819 RepID=A0A5C3KL51_COPMA|nr:hypothetical protein FA15DRAFT_673270 [Coprinopsis marcescibilis]
MNVRRRSSSFLQKKREICGAGLLHWYVAVLQCSVLLHAANVNVISTLGSGSPAWASEPVALSGLDVGCGLGLGHRCSLRDAHKGDHSDDKVPDVGLHGGRGG